MCHPGRKKKEDWPLGVFEPQRKDISGEKAGGKKKEGVRRKEGGKGGGGGRGQMGRGGEGRKEVGRQRDSCQGVLNVFVGFPLEGSFSCD